MPSSIVMILTEILPLVPGMILNVSSAIDAWNAGTAKIKQLQDEDRDLTPEELDEIRDACRAADAAIQAL